ncbi:MAG: ABC transporter transmembrane domain-containing protein [Pseudomonadota bacterium]
MEDDPRDRAKARSARPLLELWPFVRPHQALLYGALAALFLAAGLTLVIPVALGRVVDVFTAEKLTEINDYFLVFFVAALVLAAATAARYYFVTTLGERVIADIRSAVYHRMIAMSPGFFERMRIGETLSRLTTDTTVILTVLGSSASVALRNTVILVGGLLMLLFTSFWLTLLVLVLTPVVVAPVIILGNRVRDLSRVSQDRIADSSGFAGETLAATTAVQAFTYEGEARRRFSASVERAFEAAQDRIRNRAWLTALVVFLAFSAVVGVMWVGARGVLTGSVTPGAFTQFILYAVFVAGSVAALSEVWGDILRAAGAAERLVELLNAKSPIQAPARPRALPKPSADRPVGAVAFDAVTFRYPARPETPALDRVTLGVDPGETVALVGPSGAGKSTLFQLLLRFYDPEHGAVRLDGEDLTELDPEALRTRFAVVPQEPAIFADSIGENIRFGRPSASDAEVEAAAEAAAAHGFITRLPQGYATQVGERGMLLSGGQKQRVAIARAILRDAPILLLDEATSALDAESERSVQAAVERLSAGRTTLVVAHRLSTVKRADRIIVMDEGRIVSQGDHESLVREGGLYARLAKLQFMTA